MTKYVAFSRAAGNNQVCKLGTKYGVIAQLYTRNKLTICEGVPINIQDVLAIRADFEPGPPTSCNYPVWICDHLHFVG